MNAFAWLDALDRLGFAAMRYLLSALWQSSLLFVATFALAWFLRKRRASVRHLIWVVALLVAPLLPVLTSGVRHAGAPQAPVSVLPTYAASTPLPRIEPLPEPPPSPVVSTPREAPQRPAIPNPWKCPWALCFASYAVGLTFLFAWFVAGRLRIRQWIRSARPATGERVLSVFRSALEGTQPASHRALLPFLSPLSGVQILEGPGVPAPISTGILHPRVLLPIGLAGRLSDEELRAVALHEIAHLRRHDPLILTLAALVRALLFFHPLVWIAARQISSLSEQCADDAVLEATGQAVPYARLLARLAEELPHRPLSAEMATGLLLGKSAFLRRVEAILSGRRLSLSRLALAGTLIAVLVSLVIALAVPLGEKKGPNSASSEKAEWGSAVEGVQVRLRADKIAWNLGETPAFAADVRNTGKKEFHLFSRDEKEFYLWQSPESFKVAVDGRWYSCNFMTTADCVPFGKNKQTGIPLSLEDYSREMPGGVTGVLTEGEHTIQIALIRVGRRVEGSLGAGNPIGPVNIEALSNPVEIEIVAKENVVEVAYPPAPSVSEQPVSDQQIQSGIDRLASKEPREREEAAALLGERKEKRAAEPLIAALKDADATVRRASARALGQIGDARAVEPLLEALKSEKKEPRGDSGVREWTVEALGNLGDRRAVDPLIELLKDETSANRNAAIVALGQLGDQRAAKFIVPCLRSDDHVTRGQAVRALDELRWEPADRVEKLLYLTAAEKWDEALKAAPEVRPTEGKTNVFEGNLETGIPILIPLATGEVQKPRILKYPWLEFQETEGRLDAELHLRNSSWPKTKWILAVELLDAAGKSVARVETNHESSGYIMKFPFLEENTIRFELGQRSDLTNATRFRFSIESVWTEEGGRVEFDKELPLQVELNAPEYSRTIGAQWVKFTKKNDAVEAVVRLTTLSWPKSRWRLSIRLLGEEGWLVGEGQTDLGNEGIIISYPLRHERDIRLAITAPGSDLSTATRFTVILERLIEPGKESSPQPPQERGKGADRWAWGQPRDGVRVGAAAALPDQPFVSIIHQWRWIEDEGGHGHHEPGPGTPVLIRYKVVNGGKRTLFFYGAPSAAIRGRAGWGGGRITVIGPDGKPLPLRRAVSSSNKKIDLPPGQSYEGTIRLTDYFDFPAPGTYRVSIFLQLHYNTLFGRDKIIGVGSSEFPLTLLAAAAATPTPDPRVQTARQSLDAAAKATEAHRIDSNAYPKTLLQLTTPVAYLSAPPANPLGLSDDVLKKMFYVGQAFGYAHVPNISFESQPQAFRDNPPEKPTADVDCANKKNISKDSFSSGTLRFFLAPKVTMVYSAGPDGDWDDGKKIDPKDPTLDGDLSARLSPDGTTQSVGDPIIVRYLEGKNLVRYLRSKQEPVKNPEGPPFPERGYKDGSAQHLVWGPVNDGLRAAVELVPTKSEYLLGEPIKARIHVENVSTTTIQVLTGNRQELHPAVRDGQGNTVSVTNALPNTGLIEATRKELKPGQAVVYDNDGLCFGELASSPEDFSLGTTVHGGPGVYALTFPNMGFFAYRPEEWVGSLEMAPVKVTVAGPAQTSGSPQAGHWIEGFVFNKKNEPLKGVPVQALTPLERVFSSFSMPKGHEPLSGANREVKTDARGFLRLENSPADLWRGRHSGEYSFLPFSRDSEQSPFSAAQSA